MIDAVLLALTHYGCPLMRALYAIELSVLRLEVENVDNMNKILFIYFAWISSGDCRYSI